jgi:hypothetical protein
MRRLNNFIRRLAMDRDTRFSEEMERLERAAEASGTCARTFFIQELDLRSPAASSAAAAMPPRPKKENDISQGGCKGKGKAHGKQGSKGKHSGKNKPSTPATMEPKSPPVSPRRERQHKKEPNKDIKKEEVEVDEVPEHAKREGEEAGGSPDPSPTTSPLPVGTIPAGASRSNPTGTPLPEQYMAGTFPKAALPFVTGTALCCLAAPEEFHHLYRARPVGQGKQPPSTEGRRLLPLRVRGDGQVASCIGNLEVPAMPKVGYRLCQHKGWPIGFNSLERMVQVSRKMGEYLRHRESSIIDPLGFSPVGELAIELLVPVADIMDAALFSWHGKHGWRYSLEFDKVEPSENGEMPQNPHTISYEGWRATVRAVRKHSIEILTTDGIVGGDAKLKGKGKGKGGKKH